MALTIGGSSSTSRLTARLSTRGRRPCRLTATTRRVGWESLRVVWAVRSELVKRGVCREQLIDRVRHTVGLPESGDREPRTTAIAGHGHDLNRVPIRVLWSRLLRSGPRPA
jgi:hypothetical protein